MYFVTTVSLEDYTRCVGYFKDLDKAIEAVEDNACDINEAGLYQYAVIEKIDEGLYQYDIKPLWFKFNSETEQYEKSARPNYIGQNLVGFAIG